MQTGKTWRRDLVFWHLWGISGGGTCKVWVAFLQNASGTHWGPAFASEAAATEWVAQQRSKGPPETLNSRSPDRDSLRQAAHWAIVARRLVDLQKALDRFDARMGALPGVHAEYDDSTDRAERAAMLATAIDGAFSLWFWPDDLRRKFQALLQRLRLIDKTGLPV